MSWESYGDEKKSIICFRFTFLEIPLKCFGCPEGWFLRVWVSKKTPRRPAGYDHGDWYQPRGFHLKLSSGFMILMNIVSEKYMSLQNIYR